MGTAATVLSGPGAPLEVFSVYTPLGIRFWDLTLNQPIADGLTVTLRLQGMPARTLVATLTFSGVYAFFGLPGLRAADPEGGGFGVPRTFTYLVTVEDQLGRYLPAVLVYTMDQTGAVLVGGTPDNTRGARMAYLFSAPTRPPYPGLAAIRACLVDQATGAPAAWALVTVQVGSDPETWTGISDEAGRVLVLLPYPIVQRLQLGSPPGSGQGSISDESWPMSVQVLYSPELLSFPLSSVPGASWPWPGVPNLKDVLEAQKPATLWSDPATSSSSFQTTLPLGQDVILRSSIGSPLTPSSTLNISRGSSPP